MNAPILAFLSIGTREIIIVLVVALLLFGRRLPEVARSLGKGILEFKRAVRDESSTDNTNDEDESAPPPVA